MQSSVIAIGGSYVVKEAFGRGRAVVTGKREKQYGGRGYEFLIQFPDSNKPEKEYMVQSRDIIRVWTMEDQENHLQSIEKRKQLTVTEEALTSAGYKPMWVRTAPHDQGYWIAFDGENAESVVKTLLANPLTSLPKLLEEGK